MTSAPPLAAPPRPDPASPTEGRFFRWVDALGAARRDGWIGGVCAGVAARWGVDPVIVRGLAVVATVIGLPAIVAYATAWAILPDASGRSHAADLERGRFSYAQGAILAVAIIGVVQILGLLITLAGLATNSSAAAVTAVLGALALMGGVVVAAGVIALLVRAARRVPGAVEDERRWASAASETVPAASADGSDSGTGAGGAEGAPAPTPPPPPSNDADADADELTAWRAQHSAWRERDRAWRREQGDADRAARTAAREERRAAAAAFAREAAERRRVRRAAHPRTSIAFVAVTAGAAAIAGTIAGLAAPGPLSVALGVFIAALVTALAMIVAGAIRRRSGFLAFATACLLMGGGVAVAVSVVEELHIGVYGISNVSSEAGAETYRQTFGELRVALVDASDAAPLTIEKGSGSTYVTVAPGVEVTLHASVGDDASLILSEGDEWTVLTDSPDARDLGADRTAVDTTIPSRGETTTRQSLTLDQERGYIEIRILDPKETNR
ncbi:PspC domain-containing protein [Microbacterium sp. NE2HP2]|uniref:PspC domain-containing protein n=1 Tax=Microbacterium TaxID=33882 RepID=UPI002366D7D6|nr:PspC domain-containing protein [Microbacterium plantarum]MDD7945243.1 PspC domain-containing protein [Microbacterium plantarum]